MKSFVICGLLIHATLLNAAENLPPQTGQATYQKHCVSCHGSNGAGKTAASQRMPMPDLRSTAVASMSDQELAESIGRGVQHKIYPHSFLLKNAISKEELQALVAYVRVLQKK